MNIKNLLIIGSLCLSSSVYAGQKVQKVQIVQEKTSMARVVQSTPVYQEITTTENRCTRESIRPVNNDREIGLGSLVGAAIGAQYDGGTALAGLLLGGFIADKITEGPKMVERCYPENKTVSVVMGYDVRYTYNGQVYAQRLSYDPGVGSLMEVRVTLGR